MFVLNQYNMLSANDIDDVVKLGNELVSCRNFETFKNETLEDLTRFLGAETGVLLSIGIKNKMNIGFNCSFGVSQRMHKDYVNGFFVKDPAVTLLFDRKSRCYLGHPEISRVILLENHIDYNNFTGGFFYNTFLRPLGIHHLMLMRIALRSDEDNNLLIGLHRPKGKGGFSDRSLAKARLLVPTLQGAMGNLTSRALLNERQSIIQSLGEDMHNAGLMIVNEKMDILYQSNLLRQHFSQTTPDSSASSLPPEIFQTCQEMKNSFSRGRTSCHRQICLNDHALTCDIKAVTTENMNDGLRFIIYSSVATDFRVNDQVMERCHLTGREKDIARQITLGLTNIQIAEKLGISIRTVENHLCAIYPKLKVRNRTSLTHVLSRGFSR